MRTVRATPPPLELKNNLITLERTYRLLTPLFGGGVRPAEADPVTIVRATEVRGQLRFWWRAARAGGLTLEEMRKQESRIFGAAAGQEGKASPLLVEVEVLERGETKKPFSYEPGKNFPKNDPKVAPGYFAFPLQGTKEKNPMPVQVGVRFRLRLRFPAHLQSEVEAALWAWERFGGLGGRTRRGFGAHRWDEGGPPEARQIQAEWPRYVRSGKPPEGVPSLSGASYWIYDGSWEALARGYRDFRQARNQGSAGRPGRSLWPKADALRQLLRKSSARH